MSIVSLILYAILGVLLAMGGISVTEKPQFFIPILLCVLGIEILARMRG